ncbi:MAG: hypothetical protein HFE97_06060 [Oscillospiraceae bacterium]|nr:hypothetical protein [Oscillospiraceae bacterium]
MLKLSELKIAHLASHLGYDVSYVSRWQSGVSLPSLKNRENLLFLISEFFIKNCNLAMWEKLIYTFDLPTASNTVERIHILSDFLRRCYLEQQVGANTKPTPAQEALQCRLFSYHSFFSLTFKELLPFLETATHGIHGGVSVITSLEGSLLYRQFLQWGDEFRHLLDRIPGTLEFTLIVNPSHMIEHEFSTCKAITLLLNFHHKLMPRIVKITQPVPQNILVTNSHFLLLYLEEVIPGENQFLLTTDKAVTEQAYANLQLKCFQKYDLVTVIEPERYYQHRYDLNFSLVDTHKYLLTKMYPIYMEAQTLEMLNHQHGQGNSLHWVEFQQSGYRTPKHIIIYKSALLDYIYEGRMVVDYREVIVSPDLRRRHLSDLVQKLREDHRWVLSILTDTNPVLSRKAISLSLLINSKTVYAIDRRPQKEDTLIYHFESSVCIDAFNAFLTALLTDIADYSISGSEAIAWIERAIQTLPEE